MTTLVALQTKEQAARTCTDPFASSSKAENNPDVPGISWKADLEIIIPGKVTVEHVPSKITHCTVSLECLSNPLGRNAKEATNKSSQDVKLTDSKHGYVKRSRLPPKKVTHWTSGQKRPQVDYTQFDTNTEPHSPPKKRRKVDLKRRPSRTCMAAEKYKTKPLAGPRPVCNKLSQSSSSVPLVNLATMTEATHPSTSGIITMTATEEEMQTAIEALLSLGSDMPAADAEIDENASLIPLAPQVPDPGPPPQPTDVAQTVPVVIGTVVKEEQKTIQPNNDQPTEKKKKTFVMVEYKLKQKYVNTK